MAATQLGRVIFQPKAVVEGFYKPQQKGCEKCGLKLNAIQD